MAIKKQLVITSLKQRKQGVRKMIVEFGNKS